MVLGVVADGLDELVGACVEGDHVLGGVILGRSVLVHGVHGPVAGHFCVRVDCDVAVVGGEAPAGEDLALDGRCLDACGVGGELDLVLGVVADGLDQLVLGVVEGDRVQSLIFRSRSVLVHGVHGPVAGHFCVRVDCDVAVVGGEAPAGEGLAFDGRCLDACGVGGELDFVLGVVADGLDELVGACVEGDGVLGGVILCRSIRVRCVYGDVRGHLISVLEHGSFGVSPAGEGLAFDGRCLDAQGVHGERSTLWPAGALEKSAICGIERDVDDRGVALSGRGRVLALIAFSHCDCRSQGSQSRYSCNARNNLFAKRHLGKPFLSYVTNCPKAMPSKYRPECVEFPLIRIPKDYDSCPLATFSRG